MKKVFLFLTMALLSFSVVDAKITVHTIGDSTMANYDENSTETRGWCQYLQTFFDAANVTINNCGKAGRDSRTFYTESNLWPAVKGQMKAGDYLLIQFAHNDEGTVTFGTDNLELAAYNAANSLPALTDQRGTNPKTTFREYLRKYINEAKEKDVTPVLVAPICRKYFQGATIKRNGQHDLGDKFWELKDGELLKDQSLPANDLSMSYTEAMRIVASEESVAFIDLTAATRDLYLEYGEAACTKDLFTVKSGGDPDNTHLKTMGAMVIGRLGAQMLKDAGILAEYIDIPTELTASPATLSIGDAYAGVAQQKEILLTGYGLTPESGNVTITGSESAQVSIDKTTYETSVNAAYTSGNIFQRIYVKVQFATGIEGAQNEEIVITDGTTTIKVPITANVISLAGGSPISVTWPFASKTTYSAATIVGPISAELTLSNMMVADEKSDFTDGDATITLPRIHNSDATNAKIKWPANEIDENASRYVDFAVTAPASNDIRLTSISFKIASHSTGTMCCHINTGMGADMIGATMIDEMKNMTNLALTPKTYTPAITIPAGETFHLRIHPWHESATESSGKYIALKDVVIEGMAVEPASAVQTIEKDPAQVRKVIEDGNIYIIRGSEKFSVFGQKVQ